VALTLITSTVSYKVVLRVEEVRDGGHLDGCVRVDRMWNNLAVVVLEFKLC